MLAPTSANLAAICAATRQTKVSFSFSMLRVPVAEPAAGVTAAQVADSGELKGLMYRTRVDSTSSVLRVTTVRS